MRPITHCHTASSTQRYQKTHDMWYKHRAQKVPRRKNPRNKCASVDPRSSANTCAPDPRDPTKRRERLGSLTQFLRALRRLCGHTAEKYRLAHMGPAPGTPNVVVPVPSMGHRHVCVRHRWTQHRGSNGSYGSARSPWSRRPLGDPLQRLHHRNFPRPTNFKTNWMFRSPCRCPSHPSHTSSRLLHLAAAGKVKLARADLFLVYL